MKLKENQVRLLPHKFKFVGWSIILLVILFVILKNIFSFQFVAEYRALIKDSCLSLCILGLLIISLTKETIEDERTKQMKVNAMAASFIVGALYAVFMPVVNACFGEYIHITTGQGLMFFILSMHVGMLYGQKFDNWLDSKKEKHDKLE